MRQPHVRQGVGVLGAALVLLLVWAVPGLAQATGTIQGTVTAQTGGGALPGIEVQVVGTTLFGVTGADGRFQIRSVPAGPRAIRVTSIGYMSIDTVAIALMRRKRDAFKGEPWPLNPPPKVIPAADTVYHLGTCDPARIKLVRLGDTDGMMI